MGTYFSTFGIILLYKGVSKFSEFFVVGQSKRLIAKIK
jgi:hypothetical protein